jgi:hypothetical protein
MSVPSYSPCQAPAEPSDDVHGLMWDETDAIPARVLVQVSDLLRLVSPEEWFGGQDGCVAGPHVAGSQSRPRGRYLSPTYRRR